MSGCKRSTLKKYSGRPSPPFPANQCHGKVMKGNDGTQYTSVAGVRGIHTWKKLNSTRKVGGRVRRYQIYDNGIGPFLADVNEQKKHLTVYEQEFDFDINDYLAPKLIKEYTYKQIWIGSDPLKLGYGWTPKWTGNSIVAKLGADRFLSVGWKIQEFSLVKGDEPVLYESPVGNSGVPYPYMIGKTHTYLLREEIVVPNEWLDLKKDAYAQYYGLIETPRGPVEPHAKKLRMKLIRERSY